jgi:hypothetical protein
MFLNKTDKKIVQDNVISLTGYGENTDNNRPSIFAISSAGQKCKKEKRMRRLYVNVING